MRPLQIDGAALFVGGYQSNGTGTAIETPIEEIEADKNPVLSIEAFIGKKR